MRAGSAKDSIRWAVEQKRIRSGGGPVALPLAGQQWLKKLLLIETLNSQKHEKDCS